MKRKNYVSNMPAFIMLAVICVGFSSCGDDDNDDLGIANKNHSYLKCPDNHHPHFIDLGLPSGTKWACCNVGANKPEDYGGYYAWGEIEEKTVYNEVTYQYCTGEDTNGDGLYDKDSSYQNLGSDIASTQYDVAHMKWGGSWVMPSVSQFEELLVNCTSTWTTREGVYGRQYTGPSGGAIFMPAAGYRWTGYLGDAGLYGSYWSSSLDPSNSYGAYYLYFYSGYESWFYESSRIFRGSGHSVRPVINVSTNINHH